MKQSEKLDIILKELYKFRFDGKYYDIGNILECLNISFEPYTELRMLGKRLEEDGLIRTLWQRQGPLACLTSHGIEYCEENSYTYKNHSIITNNYNLSISNSPNANIVSDSSEVNINITNYSQIKDKIKEIRKAVEDQNISTETGRELSECLDEIEVIIDSQKQPKFAYKQLLEIGSNISGISALIIELGRLIAS